MSAHERERLSAYLDDELGAAERAAVEAHLAACAPCREALAALAAVDGAAASLPAEAPEGYFDDFARRVRGRIESQAAATPVRRRIPVWGWAAAAALLLAVVTPLTLRERGAATPAERAGAPARPAAKEAPVPAATAALDALAEEKARPQAAPAAAPQEAPAPLPTGAGSGAPGPMLRQSAPARREEPAAAVAPVPAAGPPPAQRPFASEPPAPVQGLQARAVAEEEAAAPAASRGNADAAAKVELANAGVLANAVGPSRAKAAGAVSAEAASPVEIDFRRLASEQPDGPEAWRVLRERWRAFASTHAQDARADEARVRVIACGAQALRAGGDEADRAVLRRDAEAYLARADGRQKPRVRALLEDAASR